MAESSLPCRAARRRRAACRTCCSSVAAAERPPDRAPRLADEVPILFPWGSLLRGALALDDGCGRAGSPRSSRRAARSERSSPSRTADRRDADLRPLDRSTPGRLARRWAGPRPDPDLLRAGRRRRRSSATGLDLGAAPDGRPGARIRRRETDRTARRTAPTCRRRSGHGRRGRAGLEFVDRAPPSRSRRLPRLALLAVARDRPSGSRRAVVAASAAGARPAADAAAATPLPPRPRPDRNDFVAQTNFVQCVGASMQMMLNIMGRRTTGPPRTQRRLQIARPRPVRPHPAGLRAEGRQRPRLVGRPEPARRRAVPPRRGDTARRGDASRGHVDPGHRQAGRAARLGRPSRLGDERLRGDRRSRAGPSRFKVTKAIVLDPLYPYGSSRVGREPEAARGDHDRDARQAVRAAPAGDVGGRRDRHRERGHDERARRALRPRPAVPADRGRRACRASPPERPPSGRSSSSGRSPSRSVTSMRRPRSGVPVTNEVHAVDPWPKKLLRHHPLHRGPRRRRSGSTRTCSASALIFEDADSAVFSFGNTLINLLSTSPPCRS